MTFERARVAEVWAGRGDSSGRAGSGYLVTDRHVLTAAHLLEPVIQNSAGACEVRCLGGRDWSKAEIVWRHATLDVAVLELVEQDRQVRVAQVRWGRIFGNQPVSCMAVGFPDAQVRPDHTREPEQVMGRIPPLTTSKANRLAVHVLGSAPTALSVGKTPWAGFSGAAVFVDSMLVGVVVQDPANFGTDRLTATPVAQMIRLGEAAEVLMSAGVELSLEPVPRIYGVEFPRRQRLPETRSPSMLLRSEFAVVPFRGRQAELESWVHWCAEDRDTPAVRLLVGTAGIGKTRFATELAERMDAQGWFIGFVSDRGADSIIEEVAEIGAPSLLVIDYAETRRNLSALLSPLRVETRAKHPCACYSWRVVLVTGGGGCNMPRPKLNVCLTARRARNLGRSSRLSRTARQLLMRRHVSLLQCNTSSSTRCRCPTSAILSTRRFCLSTWQRWTRLAHRRSGDREPAHALKNLCLAPCANERPATGRGLPGPREYWMTRAYSSESCFSPHWSEPATRMRLLLCCGVCPTWRTPLKFSCERWPGGAMTWNLPDRSGYQHCSPMPSLKS